MAFSREALAEFITGYASLGNEETQKKFRKALIRQYKNCIILKEFRMSGGTDREIEANKALGIILANKTLYQHLMDDGFVTYITAIIKGGVTIEPSEVGMTSGEWDIVGNAAWLGECINRIRADVKIEGGYGDFGTLARGLGGYVDAAPVEAKTLIFGDLFNTGKELTPEEIAAFLGINTDTEDDDDGGADFGTEESDSGDILPTEIPEELTTPLPVPTPQGLDLSNEHVEIDEKELKDAERAAQSEDVDGGIEETAFDSDSVKSDDIDKSKIDTIETDKDDTSEDVDTSDIDGEALYEIDLMINSIVKKNEAVFRACLELDRPHGMLYNKGEARYKIENGKCFYTGGVGTGGRGVLERTYNELTKSGGITCAEDLRNVPNLKNIKESSWNYYPGRMLDYALGSVSGKPHKNWGSFEKELRADLKKRLVAIYKDKDANGDSLFFSRGKQIEASLCNALLVLERDPASGMKIRYCNSGKELNPMTIEKLLKSIHMNSTISVTYVSGCTDVVDIQIMSDEGKFLSKPSWAYKAMEVKLNNGEKPDITVGIPIGRKVNGEIVNCTFDVTNDFLTFIAAGSGAGKGVLTLSLLGAFLGSGLPVFYTDYKPDMAPIFWEAEKHLGVPIFSYDAMVKSRVHSATPEKHTRGYGMQEGIKYALSQFTGAIMYLKSLQLMCAIADWGIDHPYATPLVFVFDEIQAMQRVIQGMVGKIVGALNSRVPQKGQEPTEEYKYLCALSDWIKDVDNSFNTYLITTGRAAGIYSIFIGQNPNASIWTNMKTSMPSYTLTGKGPATATMPIELLSKVTAAGTVRKIIGRGAANSSYGLSNPSADAEYKTGLRYVNSHRFFGMYHGNTTSGAEIDFFKPFLTLNTDDIFDKCWTKGMGKTLGYGQVSREKYIQNVATVHPGNNEHGIHSGTGFEGLAAMYMDGDQERLKQALGASMLVAEKFLQDTGLSQMYSGISDYMYDCSIDGLLTMDQIKNFGKVPLNSTVYELKSAAMENDDLDMGDFESNVDFGEIPTPTRVQMDFGDEQKPLDIPELISLPHPENTFMDPNAPILNLNNPVTPVQIDDELFEDTLGAEDLTEEQVEDLSQQTGYDPEELKRILEAIKLVNPINGFNPENPNQRVTMDTKNSTPLDETNSINCSIRAGIKLNWLDKICDRFKSGPSVYAAKLWEETLDCCTNQLRADLITQAALVGGNMYVNGMMVNLNGVIGGPENVKLNDIVSFKEMFNKFHKLKEICVDSEMETEWLYELKSDSLHAAFPKYKNLRKIVVTNGRNSYTLTPGSQPDPHHEEDTKSRQKLDRVVRTSALTTMGNRWDNNTRGKKVWGINSAGKLFGSSGEYIKGNKWVRGLGAAALGATVGIVGSIAWFGTNLFKSATGFGGNK